jgi:hypothetical protein
MMSSQVHPPNPRGGRINPSIHDVILPTPARPCAGNLYLPDRGMLQPSSKARDWWSQTGSNRRPHACKARALPTELWPLSEAAQRELSVIRPIRPRIHRNVVGPGGLEPPTSRLSGVCSNQLSYRPLKRHVPTTRSSLTRRGTRDRTTAS